MRPSGVLPPRAAADTFAAAVAESLVLTPRQLPSRYFYDALGSALFEAICELPWYRITRAERALLERCGHAMVRELDPLARVIELGPGNGTKLKALVESARLPRNGSPPLELHLIDLSSKALADADRTLSTLPDVRLVSHEAAYEDGLAAVMREWVPARTLVLFLGSNIGNFDPGAASQFLGALRASLTSGDGLLIGADLVKPESELLLAYDDPLGVTAAFNRNLLARINRELGGHIDLDAFVHSARWNEDEHRVEMHLVSRRRQRMAIDAAAVDFVMDEGETIWTESSYKYRPGQIGAMLGRAGFQSAGEWFDEGRGFGVTLGLVP
jgi:dimethylhistidine N-methyltransferase